MNRSDVQSVDLDNVLKGVKADLKLPLEESRGEIICHSLPKVIGIESLFHSIFLNIIHNSVKYKHPDRTPVVTISGQLNERPCNTVTIEVRDNGIGFNPDDAKHIFDYSFQCNDEKEGAGIGLGTCTRIIEFLGGSISADSTPGEGSAFFLHLRTQ
ncbi:MAG: hypothetical protein HQL32_15610 [Planctomycetes bacterium]|nr:hypothetical protein [Planctomycetota bacterium]